ncbi:MAG: HAMP domain-containing histidine kinase [Nitrosopumilus sp.]|nr:HAMP domain-containing histidine kinase [Nitrosopumilus sp.]
MDGPVIVSNNIDSNKNIQRESLNENQGSSPSPTGNPNDTFTRVYHGSDNANNVLLQFVDRAKRNIDSCVGITAPSVIIEIESIREKRKSSFRERGVKFRYVTEITKDNIEYVKQMLSFSEIRHLDGMRGNFEVADEREYVAVASLEKAQSIPQLIFSNIPEIVEQQQFVFDSFWKIATPANQKIREIEDGVTPTKTMVFSDYHDAVRKEVEMIKNAKKEIQIMYSTVNAFHIQEKDGVLQLIKEMAEQNENLKVSILSPIDTSIKDSSYLRFLKSYSKNIRIQDIAPSISIKIKSLVVDRKESLIMELKHLKEEKATALIGFSFYSNSESTVLSYASIFEVLYNQSTLFEQIKQEDSVKNEFIDIAAHELRTPIMPILNGMEILEEKLGDSVSEYRREIDIITRNASRLQNLAESILQVSRIESGTFSLTIQGSVDIHALIEQVIEDVEKKYAYTDKAGKVSIVFMPLFVDVEKAKDREWKSEGSGDDNDNANKATSPKHTNQQQQQQQNQRGNSKNNSSSSSDNTAALRPLYADCDPQKISQVIFNLLDNAMKFTFDGQILVSTAKVIHSSSSPTNEVSSNDSVKSTINEDKPFDELENNDSILVTVQDTGVGINHQIKDQLFKKFVTKSRQGTGLGLYLSKKIIESHGGHIWYEEPSDGNDKCIGVYSKGNSKKKTGTVFRFVIPMSISKKTIA